MCLVCLSGLEGEYSAPFLAFKLQLISCPSFHDALYWLQSSPADNLDQMRKRRAGCVVTTFLLKDGVSCVGSSADAGFVYHHFLS